MASNRRRLLASRHLVCGNCGSWIQHENSGCGKTWAETTGDGFEFTCKGCTEAAALMKEVEGLGQIVEDMKETVPSASRRQRSRNRSKVTATGVNLDREDIRLKRRQRDTLGQMR